MAGTVNLLSHLITLNQRQMVLFNELIQQMQTVQALLTADSTLAHSLEHPTAPPESPFYSTFFGSFVVYRSQSQLSLGHNKSVLELCRYLFAHPGQMISRDILIDLLWPDSALRQSTHRLHVAISALRQILGGADTAKSIILHEEDHYVLPSHFVVSDCDLFESYYQHAKRWLHQRDFAKAADAFRHAIAFYHGDYLVEHAYAEWTHTPRAYFAECRLNALTFLCEYAAMQNDFAAIIDYAAQLLALDSVRERPHRSLMRAYYALGQRATAVAQYRRCLNLLEGELGVLPSQQTQQLFHAICNDTQLPDEIPLFKNHDNV
jgi:DNA-binding SARP family transcriptional activator